MRRRQGKHVPDFWTDYNTSSVKKMFFLLNWWIPVITFTAIPWCEAVQVNIRDTRRFALLFQSVVLPCQYTSTSTQTPVVQWWYKSYCHDRTRDALSFPESLWVRGSELGAYSHLDCSDSSRTVRVVASGQGSSLTIADYYKGRDISIINKADLRIGELQWGDSGVYYCKVVIADDLEGPNEDHVELLVLGQTGVADDLLPEIDLEIMPEWVFVTVVILGGVLFFVLAGVCWCQCCPHSCCCYVRCCCCPETCCCPRHLYEAGKGIKTAPSTPVAIYPPYYMQGMPAMVPISPPSLVEPKMSTAPSIDNNISSHQQSSVHSGYRLQPTPDQSSLKVLQYVERELAHFNPSKTLSSHDSCSMSELSSLHEAETDFHQAYRKVQKKALPAIPDMDDPPDILSRQMSPVHAQTSARHPHHRVKEDHPRWNPRSEHLQRKAFQTRGRTGSLDELEEFAMSYVQHGRHDNFSDDEADYMTSTKQRQCEHERERRRERELERDPYPYYSSKRSYTKDVQDRPRPPSSPPLPGNPKRRGTGDCNLRREPNAWDPRRQEAESEQDYDDALLNSLLERKAKAGRSLSSKGGQNEEESDRPSKNSSQKSCHSHSPSNRSASNRPAEEDDSLPPYAEREPERFRGAMNSHQPLTSTRSRKEQENREELSRPRKVIWKHCTQSWNTH
ncbi:immunoglobulin-like domain-containing receptor 2 isoform X3 [Pangasianodon hypophthalmus]|uniref:immunoglobulin-like domain-containing receptor 2 isoform X3 n=1 Tax=Pangasianodon hypophthalmus TaxID=310915 RepID=UPI002307E210|nr:immunoglobulin-like domain-containing receptor 2 isoform X3 [Pangasianodon hypophthalmus]